MKTRLLIFSLLLVIITIAGCASTKIVVLEEIQAPEDWVVEVKQSIGNPLHWRFTLVINGQEILKTLSNSKESIKGEYRGREISMAVEFQIKLFKDEWIVIIGVDGVPTYKKSFPTMPLIIPF